MPIIQEIYIPLSRQTTKQYKIAMASRQCACVPEVTPKAYKISTRCELVLSLDNRWKPCLVNVGTQQTCVKIFSVASRRCACVPEVTLGAATTVER